jgi:hypothetical protein
LALVWVRMVVPNIGEEILTSFGPLVLLILLPFPFTILLIIFGGKGSVIVGFVVVQNPTQDHQIFHKYMISYHYHLSKKYPRFSDGGGPP